VVEADVLDAAADVGAAGRRDSNHAHVSHRGHAAFCASQTGLRRVAAAANGSGRVLRRILLMFVGALLAGCGGAGDDRAGVILLRYLPGSESTEQRERGFLETLQKEFPTVHVLSSDQFSGTTPEESLNRAQGLLQKYQERVQGLFAVCEPNASGVLRALEETGLAGNVKFIAFDSDERLSAALREGKVHGIVLQDPVYMGEMAVKTMVQHLDGEKVNRRISTGEYMATPTNMDDPKIADLLHPKQFSEDFVPEKPKYRIAVIPKGTSHEFWKSVHYGAVKAAREMGNVQILWKGPQKETNRDEQISIVQDFITERVSGICLAPLDSQALVGAVREAGKEGIPTVIYDSGLGAEDAYVSYVATDNFQGGALAARRLAEVLGAKPK
jgi:ABC-type sugar transport system substrate-binding protein